jgi:ADP-ribose pyrophosphatase
VIYLYYATELKPGETNFDDNEAIDILEFELQDLKKMVLSGEIEDAKTIAAILLVESAMER